MRILPILSVVCWLGHAPCAFADTPDVTVRKTAAAERKTSLASDDLATTEIKSSLTPEPVAARVVGIKSSSPSGARSVTRTAPPSAQSRTAMGIVKNSDLRVIKRIGAASSRQLFEGEVRTSVVKSDFRPAAKGLSGVAAKRMASGGSRQFTRAPHGSLLDASGRKPGG